jgi:1-acyl-sn-glycerol-3-phosphate acyltransferase
VTEEKLVPMKAQVYKDPRPEAFFDQYYERSQAKRPNWVYELVRLATTVYAYSFFRTRCISSDKVPLSGPVILAPNHFSFMDHFFAGAFTRRKVRFMAKSQMFKGGRDLMTKVYTHGGVFPVRRGFRDEKAFETANVVLRKGGVVCMYCEGGRSRTGQLAEQAKPGIGRLALESGAIVVPIAIHGSSKVRNWKRLQFPKVTVQYGEPFRYEQTEEPSRNQQQVVADEIFTEIKALYAGLDQHGRAGVAKRVRAERRAARRGSGAATA